LKKQRFRWCFGGIQILKKHWEALMPWAHSVDPENHLTLAQRYYYLVGGLQWFNEPINLIFTIFLIVGAIIHFSPGREVIRPLTGPLLIVPTLFLIVGIWRFMWVLRYTLHLSRINAIRAMENFFSLSWTVTLACIQGLIQPAGVFMRTPKTRSSSGMIRAIRTTQWETIIGLTCVGFAIAVNVYQPQPTTLFLGALLIWQGSLYLSATYYSLASMDQHELRPHLDARGASLSENWIARLAMVAGAAVLIAVVGLLLVPAPPTPPSYAQLQPKDIQVQQLVGLPPVPTATPTTPPLIVQPTLPTAILPATLESLTPLPITETPVITNTPLSATPMPLTATSLATNTPLSATPLPTVTPVATTILPSATPPPTLAPTNTPLPTSPPIAPTVQPSLSPTPTATPSATPTP